MKEHIIQPVQASSSLYLKDELKSLKRLGKITADPNEYRFIDSIRYENELSQLTNMLPDRCGFKYFSTCINFGNGEKYYLSNNPGKIAIPYAVSRLDKMDDVFSTKAAGQVDHFFPEDRRKQNPFNQMFLSLIEEMYGVHNAYVLVRHSEDCTLFMCAANDTPIADPKRLYRQTKLEMEQFAVNFFDQHIKIIEDKKPCFKALRIFSEPNYRKRLIHNEVNHAIYAEAINLNENDILILQWSKKGKSVDDISVLLNLSVNTINKYKNKIVDELNVTNFLEATHKAKHLGIIV